MTGGKKFQWYNSGENSEKYSLHLEKLNFMLDKIAGIEDRYQELNQLLMEVGDDYQRATELSKERAEIEPLIVKADRYRQVIQQLDEARSLADEDDDEMRELAGVEIEKLEIEHENLEQEIKTMLLPQDARDIKSRIAAVGQNSQM